MHATIDHLLYGSPDLELGMDEIERLTGVRPRYGGQHLGLGTRNALLSLGAATYLEVIAPDPSQGEAGLPLPYGIGSLEAPALRAWAAAPEDIEAAVKAGREAGIDFGDVAAHSRRAPDGEEVRWRMATRSREEASVAIIPFLIDWGSTTHPSQRSPAGVRLGGLRIVTPEPLRAEHALRAIGAGVPVSPGEAPGLEAVLVGRSGSAVLLQS